MSNWLGVLLLMYVGTVQSFELDFFHTVLP